MTSLYNSGNFLSGGSAKEGCGVKPCPGKASWNSGGVRQCLQWRSVQGADIDPADDAGPLQVVQGRKKQIIRDHPSTHDHDIETFSLCSHRTTPPWVEW